MEEGGGGGGGVDLSLVPYGESSCRRGAAFDGVVKTEQHAGRSSNGGGGGAGYRECMRNHAAGIGGHALDGCGEFMAAGGDGGLKCAACGCHRNFHRKEVLPFAAAAAHPLLLWDQMRGGAKCHQYHPFTAPYKGYGDWRRSGSETPPAPAPAPSRRAAAGEEEEGRGRKRRHRTKFTEEQKEKMAAFAERVGWRMQRADDGAMHEFCREAGVSRQVLKVWMHNHRNASAAGPAAKTPPGDSG